MAQQSLKRMTPSTEKALFIFLETKERSLPIGAESTPCLRGRYRIGEGRCESTQYRPSLLPPYSSIEPLWRVMNEYDRNKVYFSSKKALITAIKELFDVALPEIAGSQTSRITDSFQLLNPASSKRTGISRQTIWLLQFE